MNALDATDSKKNRRWSAAGLTLLLAVAVLAPAAMAQNDERRVLARGAESYGPVTPIETRALRSLATATPWKPGDPIKEVPRRSFPAPDDKPRSHAEGLLDPLPFRQLNRQADRVPTIAVGLNFDGQGFSGATPPDTVGDVGPNHYVQAVNASRIAIYDKAGTILPGYPILLESLAPAGSACANGFGDPIVLYDWLADRWFLQEFTNGGTLCLYVSTTPDPTGTYNFYSFVPPSFPDYPHYAVWPDAYYAATNEAGGGGNQTTYAFDRVNMLAGNPATMQRLTVVPPLSAYNFQTLTPADHDGDTAPPLGEPGIFMRHNDDEAHGGPSDPATDFLEMWEMSVDFATPANTTVTALPTVSITDFNSWMINYTTFFSTSQPGSGILLDAIREAILQRLVYRNFGTHETLLGVFATNRDPATSGSNVEQGNRWFELRRSGGAGWVLHDEGTFGGDANSSTSNFFMGSVAMNRQGDIALGYSKTDTGASPVFPSVGFTGRLAIDAAGTMGPENDAVIGGGASGSGRWGDYAAMSIDPADDCTFWFTTEYIDTPSDWSTRITSLVFEECLFGFILTPTPDAIDVCAPTDPDPTFDIDVTSVGGWSFSVDLDAASLPAGTTASFAPDNQLPNFTSMFTVQNTDSAATGSYMIDISGTGSDAPPTTRNSQVVLNLAAADPGTATLDGPADGATGEGLQPTFTWLAASDAVSYLLEVATDAAFTNIVASVPGLTGLSHTLSSPLDPSTTYHWRVTAENVCGTAVSAVFEFRTVLLICQTFDSADVPLPIPPTGTSGTTTSTLGLGSGGVIADVNLLNLTGTHTFTGDLDISLVSPASTSVDVIQDACGTNEDFDINFDDEAAPGAPPCPLTDGGTYQPLGMFSDFNGEDSAGTWSLVIVDDAGGDSGQLDTWSLEICTELDPDVFRGDFETGDTCGWSDQVPPPQDCNP